MEAAMQLIHYAYMAVDISSTKEAGQYFHGSFVGSHCYFHGRKIRGGG